MTLAHCKKVIKRKKHIKKVAQNNLTKLKLNIIIKCDKIKGLDFFIKEAKLDC